MHLASSKYYKTIANKLNILSPPTHTLVSATKQPPKESAHDDTLKTSFQTKHSLNKNKKLGTIPS